jgi:hypothetical protein
MAPLMVGSLIVATVLFSAATIWKLGAVEDDIRRPSPAPMAIAWPSLANQTPDFDRQVQLATLQASYALEREVIDRRYGQATLAFETRLWTRFMGFVTGMILAMVGAAFVLGKLDMDPAELAATAHGASFSLRSASPGVVLAVLGTVLMSLSLAIPVTADTRDGAIYFGSAANPILPPPDINSIDAANPANASAEPQPRKK